MKSVNKIILIKELYNKPISQLELTISNLNQIPCLSKINTGGNTSITLIVKNNGYESVFKLHKTNLEYSR